jgi:hypothetical protein
VPEQAVCDGLLSQIPDLDVVVDSSREELVSSLGQTDGGDWEICRDEGYGVFCPRVPDLQARLEAFRYYVQATYPNVAVV